MESAQRLAPGRYSSKPYRLGPSLEAVLQLYDPGISTNQADEILPIQDPPLQRPFRRSHKPPAEVKELDCLDSHLRQLQQRELEMKKERRSKRREHRQDMRELRDQFKETFAEMAARRSWHREVADDHLRQALEHGKARVTAHREAHTMSDYWPFGTEDKRMPPPIDKKAYATLLLSQATSHAASQLATRK